MSKRYFYKSFRAQPGAPHPSPILAAKARGGEAVRASWKAPSLMPKPRDRRPPRPPPPPPEPWEKRPSPRRREWLYRELARRLAALYARKYGKQEQKAPGLATEGSARPDEPAWDDHGAYAMDED